MANRPSTICLHPEDSVAIALTSLKTGQTVPAGFGGGDVVLVEDVAQGHKFARRAVDAGAPMLKYGQVIGYATRAIAAGAWVHVHNIHSGELTLDYAFSTAVPPAPTPIDGRTFPGYRRADGRAATRNYIGIVSTVNCSATASRYAAQAISRELLSQYPEVDGVVPLVHKGGCAIEYGGEDHRQLARTLSGFARHPNIAAYLVIGLGCETAQASFLKDEGGLTQLTDWRQTPSGSRVEQPLVMNIQEVGGVAKTVDRAVGAIREMLPDVNRARRVPIPVSEILLGLECGGSDGYSGITANPALGYATDLLVAHGGTGILSETPEIYGGEHLLTSRAVSRQVGEQLLERIEWWKEYVAKFGGRIDNNPSVGNKQGGLTTIYEKSLGAIAKAGTTALRAVYQYAEPITEKGLVVMDTPGYDPASVTGIVAGGSNVVCFTTGRGSCFGCKPVPTIKITTTTGLYDRMPDDMDVNAGKILEGASLEEVGAEIFEKVIAVAGGERTKSELQGIGDEEFCPWNWGPVL